MKIASFSNLIRHLGNLMATLPDRRTGSNVQYSMMDIGLAAFSVFFTQCSSFLAHQRVMEKANGQNNARSLFQVDNIPTDNHIRKMLDPIPPEHLFPMYDATLKAMEEHGILNTFRGVHNTRPIVLDATWYHSSENIGCDKCSTMEHKDGTVTYYHSAITPVIVAPGIKKAISLRPEFIIPQDGSVKQDCEINAGYRWLEKNGEFYQDGNSTILGDDLYAHQPFCRRVLLYGYHFIITCKPGSHSSLYDWVNLLELGVDRHTLVIQVKNKNKWENHTYNYANGVPLTNDANPLKVNWCDWTITNDKGEQLYHNAWITDFKITDNDVSGVAATGRVRFKIENENNNTLKTKGYHLDHNFGHGSQYLSSLLAAMNILAFLFHTFLDYCDENYKLIRDTLPTRKTFFQDIQALTRYAFFANWDALMDYMMRGLEIGPYERAR